MTNENPYQAPDAELVAADNSEFPLTEPKRHPIDNGWQWIADAFALLFRGYWVWLLMGIVSFVIMMVAQFVPLVGWLASYFLWPIFVAGVMWACVQLERTGRVEFEHLFAGFSREASSLMVMGAIYLGFTIVTMVISGVVILLVMGMAGGFELFELLLSEDVVALEESFRSADILLMFVLFGLMILALTLPLLMALWFAPALTIIHGMPPFEAMKQSFLGCLKNILPFLWYSVIGLGLTAVACIPIFLGLLVVLPMFALSQYTSYKAVFTGDQPA